MKTTDKYREEFIRQTMNAGFKNAAESFGKMIGQQVSVTNFPSFITGGSDHSHPAEKKGNVVILTTDLIGQVSGRSFLILNEEEIIQISKILGHKASDILKEGFLLEIDNILSATVISKLSNELKVEVYGDVPQLTRVAADELENFINEGMANDETSSIIYSKAHFQLDHGTSIQPQFIWRLSNSIFHNIPNEKITV